MKRFKMVMPCLFFAAFLTAEENETINLSLKEAVQTSLKNNLGVQTALATRDKEKASLLFSEGAFDWHLKSDFSITRNKTAGHNGDDTIRQKKLRTELRRGFAWGGEFSIVYYPTFSHTAPDGGFYRPYDGTLTLSYSQELLKGAFGKGREAVAWSVARKNAVYSDQSFQLTMIDLAYKTEAYYWDVLRAQQGLENKRQALELVQKQLKENQTKVDLGMMAKIELAQTEASVAQAEKDVIAAETDFLDKQDILMQALYPAGPHPSKLFLTDNPTPATPLVMTEQEAEKLAVENRVELKQLKLDLEKSEMERRSYDNGMLPSLKVFTTYHPTSASYPRWNNVNSDLFRGRYPGYTIGLSLEMPLSNSAAKGQLSVARADVRLAEIRIQEQTLAFKLEARKCVRNVIAAEKAIHAAVKAREQRQKDAEAEQKKYAKGMTTNYFVLSKQKDLDVAKREELDMRMHYAHTLSLLNRALGRSIETYGIRIP